MTTPIQFIKEARSELSKVVWPSRKDIIRITLAVVILSLVVAVFLGAVDFGLSKLIDWVLEKQQV
jgi:preprotein translocase subunit SecE